MDFDRPIQLETQRVHLYPMGKHHVKELLPIALQYPDLLRYSPSPFGTKYSLRQYVKGALAEKEAKKRYPFVICDKDLQKIVGSSSYGNISLRDKRLDIGWTWLDKTVQGTGLNLHCKFLMLSYAFDTMGMERIEFKIDSRNIQSRRAVEKIGGVFEAELRSHTLMPDGYRRNTTIYSILKQEWPGLRNSVFKGILSIENP